MPSRIKSGRYPIQVIKEKPLREHLIIIGYGLNGRNLARTASAASIPYVIVEINPETVRFERDKGTPIYYGDATHDEMLKHVDIGRARVVVVAISDPAATRRIIEIARRLNPGIYILVRTRFASEVEPLYKLGANEVIPEEFETSIEIFSRVLARYFVPTDEIEKFVDEVRAEGYEMFRSLPKRSLAVADIGLQLPDIEVRTFRIAENAAAAGKTLGMLQLRKIYGVSVLAIRRGAQILSNPDGDAQLYANDIVVVVGEKENIDTIEYIFHNIEPYLGSQS
ncbi:MAG: NAD-binding protein [Candidatus Aquicultor sp.]